MEPEVHFRIHKSFFLPILQAWDSLMSPKIVRLVRANLKEIGINTRKSVDSAHDRNYWSP